MAWIKRPRPVPMTKSERLRMKAFILGAVAGSASRVGKDGKIHVEVEDQEP